MTYKEKSDETASIYLNILIIVLDYGLTNISLKESHIIKHTFSMKERTDTFLNFKHIHDCAYTADFLGSTTAFI